MTRRTSRKLRSNRRRPAITSKASKPKKLKMKWPAAIDYDTRVALGLPVHGKKSRRTSSRRSSLRRNAARNHTVVSASHSIVKGASVGITASKRTLVFASKDYDDKGNVSGPAIDVTKIADNAFYVLGYDTPTTPARRAKLVAAATRAAGLRSNSRRRTSRR